MSVKKEFAPPIFVVGNRRSGTTMLRLMLTSHPSIAIPPEGGFVIDLSWKYEYSRFSSPSTVDQFVDDLFSLGNTKDWEFDKTTLYQRLLAKTPCDYPTILQEVYCVYVEQKYGYSKKRWGDKTTWYLNHLNQINRLFPNAQFIHIIRDGLAVAASYKGVPHLSNDIKEVALDWLWSISTIRRFGKKIGSTRYYEVCYENIVKNPERELRNICEYLNESYSPDMLDFGLKNQQSQLEPTRHLGWKALTLEKVTTERMDQWKNILTDNERATFSILAGKTAQSLGYEYLTTGANWGKLFSLKWKKIVYFIKRYAKNMLKPILKRFLALIV
ncbi:MAG: sulfotransferase [Anaerolineae bacterium]|nr:sulfotransferase [Anaerolineae bacterium]